MLHIGILCLFSFSEPFQRNGDGEGGFLVGNAGDGDGSVMGFHGSFDDGEAQSRSLDFRGVMGFHPVETVEEEGEAFRGNAHARVRHGDDAGVRREGGGHGDGKVRLRVLLEGVFHQVEQDLRPVEGVSVQFPFRGDVHVQGGLLFLPDGVQPGEDVVRAGGEAEPLLFQDGLVAGFQLGDHEHVFNDVHEPLAVLVHDADEFAGQGRSFLHELVFHQVFQVSHNDGERRAQFVGGVGHEVPPHLVGEVVLRDVAQQDALFPDGGIRDGAVQMPCRDAVLHSAGGVDGAEGEFLGDGTVRVKGFLHVEQKFLIAHQGTDFAAFQAFFLKEFARQRIGQHDVSGRADEQEGLPQRFQKAPFVRNGLFLSLFKALHQALAVPQSLIQGYNC